MIDAVPDFAKASLRQAGIDMAAFRWLMPATTLTLSSGQRLPQGFFGQTADGRLHIFRFSPSDGFHHAALPGADVTAEVVCTRKGTVFTLKAPGGCSPRQVDLVVLGSDIPKFHGDWLAFWRPSICSALGVSPRAPILVSAATLHTLRENSFGTGSPDHLPTVLLAGVLVLASWRFPFFLYALALVVAVVAWRTLPPAEHEGSDGLRQYARDLLALVSEPVLAMVMLSFMIRFLLTFSFFAYVSVLLSRTIDASAVLTGVIVSLFALVSLVSAAQAGRLAEAWDMLLVTLVGILLSGIGMVVMGVFPAVPTIVAGVVLGGVGAGIAGPLQKSLVTQLAPAPLRAGALSSAVIFQSIGSAGGPLLMGIALGTLTVTTTFVVFGLGGAAAGLGVLGVAYLKAAPGQYGR